MLNKRLSACSEYVKGSGIVCDIGTDHAHLPVYLVEKGMCRSAYACDIAEGPLECAKKSVELVGLADKIKLIQSDGLKNVPSSGISDIVIAGMGGELIIDILKPAEWIREGVNLILQPNTKEILLIKWLYGNGYSVVSKKACIDGRFTYIILNAIYSGEKLGISDYECITKGLDPCDDAAYAYIIKQADRFKAAAKGMLKGGNTADIEEAGRLEALAEGLYKYIEK